MYSISIYDTKGSRAKELEKLLECYFYAKGIPVRVRIFSSLSDVVRAAGYTDIAFLSVGEGNADTLDMCDAMLRNHSGIFLYILSEKYSFLDNAMDLNVFRYLEHPVDRRRLFASLDIILNKPLSISFTSDYMQVTLRENEIVCIYKAGRKTYVLTDSGSVYPSTSSIKEWLERTSRCKTYACPHYGYIVNLKYIANFNGEAVVLKCKTGRAVTVYPSQRKMTEFKNRYYAWNRE
ncbi:MAG: LytTR family transcriptional regulator [Ruminococcus sp.]|nr:LytTR family transcriptional regulator [Ruminococcus sp.]